jgi:ABC-type multidrug transport system ATPase subunit
MEVLFNGITKTFGSETVLKDVELVLASGSRTAVLGPNGSGKSTLLRIAGGMLMPTAGHLLHRKGGQPVPQEELYRQVSIAAPYLGLYEDLSLRQVITFHARFKPLRGGLGAADLARLAGLERAMEKPVRQFSSGMKQRLKLALAILSDTALLLLDEPATNLDAAAIHWYRVLLQEHMAGRTLLVASNHRPEEHDLCAGAIEVERWKPA